MKTMIFGCSAGPPLFNSWLPTSGGRHLEFPSPFVSSPPSPSWGQRWRVDLSITLFLLFILSLANQFSVAGAADGRSTSTDGRFVNNGVGTARFLQLLDLDEAPEKQQCRLLDWNIASEICARADPPGEYRTRQIRRLSLPFCSHIAVINAVNVSSYDIELLSERNCRTYLRKLEKLDEQVYKMYCHFEDILTRFNCERTFSRQWKCNDCQKAYKSWLCASLIPYYVHSFKHHVLPQHVPPCQSYCTAVHNRCPYLLPARPSQYAGESSFLCPADSDPSHCHTPCLPSHFSSLATADHTDVCVVATPSPPPPPPPSSSPSSPLSEHTVLPHTVLPHTAVSRPGPSPRPAVWLLVSLTACITLHTATHWT